MGILDDIQQMKNSGQEDEQIVQSLKERGVSPKEINDAFNQVKIKGAVSNEKDYYPGQTYSQTQEIQESSAPQEIQEYAPQEQQYQQEPYQQGYYEGGQMSGGTDTDTIMEIAEQVFQERSSKMQSQLNNLNDIKTILQSNVENISERLKRIENTIDKLQISILNKVGSYGENLESIKKEMSMMQDTFGKMINPIADRNTRRTTTQISPSTNSVKKISRKN